ncbi:prolyl oligopeptidase family serine peptidase [uncultured Aquimarina sp.]|uniref:prolyl oligopeptidase family serine peptidase n=1 Tax=uncultured Aquimarina sp. TaxID=575652 RepID=UPI002611B4C7|nr:prolyl oligopeptidase family serine peptidase [uncultured Aquimarina sp.]
MRYNSIIILVFLMLSIYSCKPKFDAPLIEAKEAVDEYHGQKIIDPYRNLENLKDTTVISWLQAQDNYASDILKNIPGRKELIEKQIALDKRKEFNIKHFSISYDSKYFYVKTFTDTPEEKLFMRTSLRDKEQLLFSSLDFQSDSEESYVISYMQPDWKGEKIAFGLAQKGEELSKIIILDVATKQILPYVIENSQLSIGGIRWLPDNSGFTYLHYTNTEPQHPDYSLNSKCVLYKLGSDPKKLKEVFSITNNPEVSLGPEDFPKVYIYQDYDDYVFAKVSGSSKYKDVYYVSLNEFINNPNFTWKPLYKKSDKINQIIVAGKEIIFTSEKKASLTGIYKTSLENPNFKNPITLVKPDNKSLITDIALNNEGLFFVRFKNGVESKLYVLEENVEKEIQLDNNYGSIFIDSKGYNYNSLLVSVGGWTSDYKLFHYDYEKKTSEDIDIYPSISDEVYENLEVKEVEVISHDGVKVPLSLIYKKGLQNNGNNHTLFYGYGAYGGAGTPFFSSGLLNWVLEGGILAVAHVRGGGEKGDVWHKGGYKMTKPNTWKDMIACTKYMIEEKYTTPSKSVIWGSSAGGIMAGRAMTERPDLYKAVILTSPALNMLRCEIQPNGLNSIKEFGTVKKKDEFEALLEMDSYHHIKDQEKYPATIVMGGMKDGRVVIWDPAKFIARLQASNSGDTPILFTVDFESGHGVANESNNKIYEFYANAYAFALWQIGHPDYQP